MPEGTEYDSFDYAMAPHTRGVLEAWDDPNVRTILLCWGTRGCKTSTMISLLIFAAKHTPRPMVWGGPDQESVDSDFTEKHYPMLERCRAIRNQLQPKSRRGTKAILLRRCRVRKAYSGGKATVAGFPACYVFATEIDKWTGNKSSEADAFESIKQRTKGYPVESKLVAESTPSTVEKSRIWKLVTAPTTDQRLYWVPCPHCGEFQVLERGTRDTPFGLKWKTVKGRTDVALAEETAYYECRHCHKPIRDPDRPEMMRKGRWLSVGMSIDKSGKITGKPKVRSSTVAFGPLPSLYSLLIKSWGYFAKRIIEAGHNPKQCQDVQNSDFALPFDPKPQAIEPDEVAKRLCDQNTKQKLCPPWSIFLTRGVDVQDNGKTFVWVVVAWGPGGQGHLIDYGVTRGVDDFHDLCKTQTYRHADGGRDLQPIYTIIDSGDATDSVYAFCRTWNAPGRIIPSKGSSTSDFNTHFRVSPTDEDGQPIKQRDKVKRGGLTLLIVNVNSTQLWLCGHLDGTHVGSSVAAFTIHPDCALDKDFLTQLTNEYQDENGNWKKLGVNDIRDAVRNAFVGECYVTNHGKLRDQLPSRQQQKPASPTFRKKRKPNPNLEGSGRWRQ